METYLFFYSPFVVVLKFFSSSHIYKGNYFFT
eukprot:UN15715